MNNVGKYEIAKVPSFYAIFLKALDISDDAHIEVNTQQQYLIVYFMYQ